MIKLRIQKQIKFTYYTYLFIANKNSIRIKITISLSERTERHRAVVNALRWNYARHARGYKLAANLHVCGLTRAARCNATQRNAPIEYVSSVERRWWATRVHTVWPIRQWMWRREVSYSCYYRAYIDPANNRRVRVRGVYPFVTRPSYNAATYCDDRALAGVISNSMING